MLAKLYSGTVIGLSGMLIQVEVDVASRGFPTFTIVGLPNKSVDEAKDRVRTAIVNSFLEMPDSRITVNLAPADVQKIGSGFDLPIALGVLAASEVIQPTAFEGNLYIGELSLRGELRAVSGIISIALMAKEQGIENIFVPRENAAEAKSIDGIKVFPVSSIQQLIDHMKGKIVIKEFMVPAIDEIVPSYDFDYLEIKGQEYAKRAFQIAAAGFHNIHLKGVPGAGKTMLSRAFPSILPPLEKAEALEVAKIYSVLNQPYRLFNSERPFRAPHHTTSRIGLIGGGAVPSPGEISLAHRGVLFLDEFPEFPRSTLESLRQPVEDGFISISRAAGSLTFPCRFLLVAASNPCPCGLLNHPTKKCQCSTSSILFYKKKLSGPLLDRIDLHVQVLPVEETKLSMHTASVSSKELKEKVLIAKEIQEKRFRNMKIRYNSEMNTTQIKEYCTLSSEASISLQTAVSKLQLSARSYFKTIKVSQTIADLSGSNLIEQNHITEALQYRVDEI